MKKAFFFFTIIILLNSCLKGVNEFTCYYDACAIVAPQSEIDAVQSYLTSNNITAQRHCSGLFYTIENPGTGGQPTACHSVLVHYVGRLTNGSIFDQTTTDPIGFPLSNVIRGWQNAIPLIKVGGKMTIYVPPSLAYGSQQRGPIPPNSILIFTVELVGMQ